VEEIEETRAAAKCMLVICQLDEKCPEGCMIETTIHIVWDDEGKVAAHVDASEAADILGSDSSGRFRRVLELRVSLPTAGPMEMNLDVADTSGSATVRSATIR
jgi:hypothetical protein